MAANPIDSILPKPASGNLLASADPLRDGDGNLVPFSTWKNGLTGRNIGCMRATTEELWCADPDRDVYSPDETPINEFLPLKTNLPHGCKGFIDDEGRWRVEVDAALKARVSYGAARELWTGAKTGGQSFQSAANTTLSTSESGSLNPMAAIGAALADYSACTQGAQAWIHVPVVLAPYLHTRGFYTRSGDRLVTPEDHIVVVDAGYPSSAGAWGPYSDDEDTATGAVSDPGQVFIYVTGAVEAPDPEYLAPDTAKEQRHSRMNEFLVTARAATIARFDTCCVFAAAVNVPTED